MSTLEIISGVVLIVVSIGILFLVVNQDPPSNNNNALTGAIGGESQSYYGKGRTRTRGSILKKFTIFGAVIFFGATILVNLTEIL